MTLAELEQKVQDALANNTGFTEQVKVTLLVVWEQITALKTLDGYYSKEINEFKELNAKNKELTEQATQLIDTATELMDKVTTSRAEAEKIINSRIDALLVPLVYKSDYAVKVNQIVIYAGTLYLAKEAFTTTSWANDESKLVALSGGSAAGNVASNAYTAGKEIKTGEIITYQNKAYIAQSEFVASTWENDRSKFVLLSGADAYPAGKEIKKGDFITYESVIYVATADFTSATWESDSANFVKFSADTSKSVDYLANLSIVKGDIVSYNSKFYIATESFTASDWTTDEAKFVPFTNESSENAYAAGKSFALGQIVVYNDKAYVANEAFTATDWTTDEAKCTPLSNTTESLANYYTKEQIDLLLAMKMDLLTAGEGVAIEKKDGEIIVGVKNYAELAKNVSMSVGAGYKKMTAIIDMSKAADPANCVTLADDAVGKTLDELRAFIGHYPCLLIDGVEGEPLDPNDYSKYRDREEYAPIDTLGNDVMVKFPRRGLCIRTIGSEIHITFTDDPDAKDFQYYAFTKGSVRKECFYYGAYKAYVSGAKMYSSSGKTPTVSVTIGNFRNYAQARGSGYEQVQFYPHVYLQAVYVLFHQSLNSQEKIGLGKVSGTQAAISTGGANTWGMDSEIAKAQYPTYLTDGAHNIKCLGVEDLWGNCWEWLDGCVTSNYNVMTATSGFNDSGKGYQSQGIACYWAASASSISSVAGTSELGFYPTAAVGSNTTYFCDGFWQGASRVAKAGGNWNDGLRAGVFAFTADDAASDVNSNFGARLMFS
jgi:hypothetical protein